jgi:hypothetical protein
MKTLRVPFNSTPSPLIPPYTCCYFCLSTTKHQPWPDPLMRDFQFEWMCAAYAPMGFLEARLRGSEVWLGYPDDDGVLGSHKFYSP